MLCSHCRLTVCTAFYALSNEVGMRGNMVKLSALSPLANPPPLAAGNRSGYQLRSISMHHKVHAFGRQASLLPAVQLCIR